MRIPRLIFGVIVLVQSAVWSEAGIASEQNSNGKKDPTCEARYFQNRPRGLKEYFDQAKIDDLKKCIEDESAFLGDLQTNIKDKEKSAKSDETVNTISREMLTRERPGESKSDPLAINMLPKGADINIDQQIRHEHERYENLKEWWELAKKELPEKGKNTTTPTAKGLDHILVGGKTLEKATGEELITAEQDFQNVRRSLHSIMDHRGLRQIFAASLVSGVVFGDVGNPGSGAKTVGAASTSATPSSTASATVAASSANNTSATAHIIWESQHFGSDSHSVDMSFGGKFGFQPALTLVKPDTSGQQSTSQPNTTATTTEAQPAFQQAFIWNIAPRFNFHIGERSELTVSPTLGQIRLNSQSQIIEDGNGKGSLYIGLDNGAGKAELYYEYAAAYRIYDNPLHIIHEEQSQLAPVFDASFGFRRDDRFRRAGQLVAFDHPQNRFFFRFMVNGLKVIDRRAEAAANTKPFSVDFGVEYEQHWLGPSSGIPSATKIIIRGNLDLLKALQGH